MTDKPRRKLEDAMGEIDTRLSGLLGALGASLSDAIDRLDAEDSAEFRQAQEIRTARGPLRAEAGVRVRFAGQDMDGGSGPQPVKPGRGKPRAKPAHKAPTPTGSATSELKDNVQEQNAPPAAEPREAILESYVEGGRVIFCADLPGVRLPEVDVTIKEEAQSRILRVATSGARQYTAEHPVPEGADADAMAIVLRNGVLEIAIDLRTTDGVGG
ncbi:MAG: Hsp20/alpha crystallin family protein [Pseudomonadota bacterium]